MKHGKLFFYNMGKITTAARIAILPLAWTLTKFVPPAYYVSWALLITSIIIAFIHAPSDKAMVRVLENHRKEVKRKMKELCEIKDDEYYVVLDGYRKNGNMKLRRHVGKEVIYPHPTTFIFAEKGNKRYLLIVKKSLLTPTPADYELIRLTDPSVTDAIRVTSNVEADNEKVVELTLYTDRAPEGITIFAKNDYHYRDFVKAMQNAAKPS